MRTLKHGIHIHNHRLRGTLQNDPCNFLLQKHVTRLLCVYTILNSPSSSYIPIIKLTLNNRSLQNILAWNFRFNTFSVCCDTGWKWKWIRPKEMRPSSYLNCLTGKRIGRNIRCKAIFLSTRLSSVHYYSYGQCYPSHKVRRI